MNDSELTQQAAELVFRWKWVSWIGTPTRGTPGYPSHCRIREFISPERLASPRWIEFWADKELQVAKGDEPLSYAYCSSQGGECPPRYSGRDDILVLVEVRTYWPHKRGDLFCRALERIWVDRWEITCTRHRGWVLYKQGDYSRAAVEVLT